MEKLLEIAQNPEPFEKGTQEIWLDSDRADLVLKGHFDDSIPGGSKGSDFILETVEFISKIASVENYRKVIDLGCGPGLYSQKLALKGYDVIGVDFNKTSIDYAINEAEKNGLEINYRIEDITDINIDNEFDLALLIYQIYSVFSPEDRRKILGNIHRGLKPGGLVLLDVLSDVSYEKFPQNLMWGLARKDSPFSDRKHLMLHASMKYPDQVSLEKIVLIFGDGEIVNYNYWNQHFSIESFEKEVNDAGFTLEKVYADVNGGDHASDSEFFAAVLKKT
ncbi:MULTISPECIES: class I SAM-dependent methyltransferase [Paenibacillus]|jgi:SAM-dependent methyltransferase|uniref:Methyltransferase domain-containing protein n=2 Tax=Paenibacillus TaxID=44249 RepID=A0ABX2ZBU5_PAEPO|nr:MULTISPECIES: class I SAM-dependent methyltransferase [Paenibacillus]MDR6777698.1 SAM-dependent methyltransferase [Paenibacillus peoriae]ODA08571.1 hypothetical protein A7312_03990 [Paenibacillus polymyxa]OME65932.1 hypothetical protein BK119_23685 [Paenibacillus peoriae]OMF34071.1 hypothetical protein BK134_10210 [Paenibacillus peoriae]